MTGRRLASGLLLGAMLVLAAPAAALAHPLGNFTINHYAGLRVSETGVTLDVVLDFAEIPTFQERQRIDTDGDGGVSTAEAEADRQAACGRLAPSLVMVVAGSRLPLRAEAAGLLFLPGAGGLDTMRVVCEYAATLAGPLSPRTVLSFADTSYAERIGWREVTAVGDGATLVASGSPLPPATSVSRRLTHYPAGLLSQPLDMRGVVLAASPGGPAAPPFHAPDARPLAGPGSAETSTSLAALAGTVPGGERIGDLLGGRDVSPPLIAVALLVAAVLGAAHAASPGHGKTVMAAYLVGTRGSARHAVALGLVVTVSHTLGVLGLAAVTLAASSLIPPERLYPFLGAASGGIVVLIGGWMLMSRWRALRAGRIVEHDLDRGGWRGRATERNDHEHGHEQPHGHGHGNGHGHDHEHGHDDEHESAHADPRPARDPGHEHSHGPGRAHRHVPSGGSLTWRGLFSLGLAGGLVPSASALLLLLGSLAAGRPLFGLVLVIAFGAGMATVLSGVGLALVYAGRLVERLPAARRLDPVVAHLPTVTAMAVLVLGIVLTGQALHPTL